MSVCVFASTSHTCLSDPGPCKFNVSKNVILRLLDHGKRTCPKIQQFWMKILVNDTGFMFLASPLQDCLTDLGDDLSDVNVKSCYIQQGTQTSINKV